MKIRDLQRDIEESLASVPTSTLPNELSGLRHLPVNDRNPQVSIRNVVSKRILNMGRSSQNPARLIRRPPTTLISRRRRTSSSTSSRLPKGHGPLWG